MGESSPPFISRKVPFLGIMIGALFGLKSQQKLPSTLGGVDPTQRTSVNNPPFFYDEVPPPLASLKWYLWEEN